MARAYQEAHILESLTSSVKQLQSTTNELTRIKGLHEEKLKNLTAANEALVKKNEQLELRVKAKQFPKHERDITTLGQSQVIQILQALDIKTLGMGAADKKAELRAQLGLPKETSVTGGKPST
ncbi:MAG: hypothetical protein OHK93_004943 [Ramalina farinacea]|uniref:Uncharacterized protein n=1 Tax=Ramalina farinacea TaxID=258253 RepID=A0AA43TVJ3_9LECA|nr:hypothetical protein [Ramalina farinacea]